MSTATAEATASIYYFTPAYWHPPARDASVIKRYMRRLASSRPALLSDNKPEAQIRNPRPMSARWLSAIEQRIFGSILPNGRESENDGRWLLADIADAGVEFLQSTSDLLPGEPFIYSSRKGDLVAEFEGPHGTMTSIISQTFVLVFAVIDGTSIEKRAPLTMRGFSALRPEIKQLTEMLRTGRYEAVDPAN